jgi:hypothetical protein
LQEPGSESYADEVRDANAEPELPSVRRVVECTRDKAEREAGAEACRNPKAKGPPNERHRGRA